MKLARFIGSVTSSAVFLGVASNVFAQIATNEAKGGTSGALPDAGSTGMTYLIFLGGIILFVFGSLKLILSYRK